MEKAIENSLNTRLMLKNELFARQKQLICELAKIFPIQRLDLINNRTVPAQSSSGSYKLKILNSSIRLWPTSTISTSESSSANFDRENAIAMGHICHCIDLIATILGVPLRYPIVYRVSKSYIVESVVSGSGSSVPLAENQAAAVTTTTPRMLALFRQASSSQEELFLYAVSLLNADLVQIRVLFDSASHRNVDHSDLLVNLKWIFDFFNKF
jgi:hypothetical protein